jgi:hypothetical protein
MVSRVKTVVEDGSKPEVLGERVALMTTSGASREEVVVSLP